MKKSIVFTGGGTGGHIIPNLALIPYFQNDFDVHYIGSKKGMEKDLIAHLSIVTYHEIDCIKLRRSLSIKNLAIPFVLYKSVKQARSILREINPSAIFSKGGFVGLPVALACSSYPLIIHESDCTCGLANKLALKNARLLLTAFDCIKHEKALCVGAPIRQSIFQGNKTRALKRLGFVDNSKPYLLIFGGSLGAKPLNDFVYTNFSLLVSRYNVIHIVGKNESRKASHKNYRAMPFCDFIEDVFALSSFVITRGGANSLFELTALSKPCVCVPLEKGSRGDQIVNAQYFQSRGAIEVIREKDLSFSSVFSALNKLQNNLSSYLTAMQSIKTDGTMQIVDLLKKIAQNNRAQFVEKGGLVREKG